MFKTMRHMLHLCPLCCSCTGQTSSLSRSTMQATAAKTLSLLLLVFLGVVFPLTAAELTGSVPNVAGSNLASASAAGLPRRLAGIQGNIYVDRPKLIPPVPKVVPLVPPPHSPRYGAYTPVTGSLPRQGPVVSPTQTSQLMLQVNMALSGFTASGIMEVANLSPSEKCRRYCQNGGKARSWLKVESGAQWCFCDVA